MRQPESLAAPSTCVLGGITMLSLVILYLLAPQDDPVTGVAVKPEDLFTVFQKLTDENLRVR